MFCTMSTAINLFLACSALLTAALARRVKTVDLANNGDLCDSATEQYLQVEGIDNHDRPNFTMTWRQTTGQCGQELDPSELKSWSAIYDSSAGDDPNDGTSVQLNLFICSPFGEYELELDIKSENDAGTTNKRVSWEVENGPDEYHIWDTLNTEQLRNDAAYSPTAPGIYTWPIQGETGFYKTIYAGPLPPLECNSSVPSGTEYEGCFVHSNSSRLFDSDSVALTEQGPDGMTTHICSTFCWEYDYFGVESGSECYCGTAQEFAEAVTNDQCGLVYESLCTGDATTACGGSSSMSVYHRTGTIDPPTPSPTPIDTTLTYTGVGCFIDDKDNRIMSGKIWANIMSAEICFQHCNNGTNTHFGTEFSKECWCAGNAEVATNSDRVDPAECDMICASAADSELCGGYERISVYEIVPVGALLTESSASTNVEEIEGPSYVGCYRDESSPRAMDGVGMYIPGGMTNELCIEYCDVNGFAYAGSQYTDECWCGDSFNMYGGIDEGDCSSMCQGDADQICGGYFALSVYQV